MATKAQIEAVRDALDTAAKAEIDRIRALPAAERLREALDSLPPILSLSTYLTELAGRTA